MVLKKIGLTGSNGMLGRHLCFALQAAGAEVVPVSRTGASGSVAWDLSQWLDLTELDEIFAGAQAIVHAGAVVQPSDQDSQGYMLDANVRACFNLGQWAIRRNLPFLHISGAIVYANPHALLQKESAPLGWSGLGGLYGFSKLLAENVLVSLRQQGLKLCILRPTSIYGYGIGSEKMVSRLLTRASRNEVIELRQPVNERIDFVHASDVSAAAVAALKGECWQTLNVSSGEPISIIDLAEACITVAGGGHIEVSGDIPSNCEISVTYSLDIARAEKYINWRPCIGIYKGLRMLMQRQCLSDSFIE